MFAISHTQSAIPELRAHNTIYARGRTNVLSPVLRPYGDTKLTLPRMTKRRKKKKKDKSIYAAPCRGRLLEPLLPERFLGTLASLKQTYHRPLGPWHWCCWVGLSPA